MSARLTLVETCGVRVVELTEVREQEGMRPLPPGPHVSQPLWWATPPPAPTGGYVHKGVLAGGAGGRSPLGKNSGIFHFYTHFSRAAASRHAPRKRALHVSALWSVLGSVFHVGRRAACALVLHCSQPLGHTACQAC